MISFKSCAENKRITFYYFSCSKGHAVRYLYKHKGKKLKISINMSWDPLDWLFLQGTVVHWKAHHWKLAVRNQGCQTKAHCSWLHYWTCQSNHRIPTPSKKSRQAALTAFRSGDGDLPSRASQSSQLVGIIPQPWKCFLLKHTVQHQGHLRWGSVGGMQLWMVFVHL